MPKTIPYFFVASLVYLVSCTVLAEPMPETKSSEPEKQQGISSHLNKINELAKFGVPGLALRWVESNQPKLGPDNFTEWLWWEQKRIQLIARLRKWQELIDRIDLNKKLWSSEEVATYDKSWFLTQKIIAHQKLNQFDVALNQIQNLLWNTDAYVDSDTISIWRRLIVQGFMSTGRIEDAQRAMRRYHQDYGTVSATNAQHWILLQAQLLMQTQRYQEAVHLLQEGKTVEEKVLQLMAKIKSNAITGDTVQLRVSENLVDENLSNQDYDAYQYVLLVQAEKENNLALKIDALESLLSLKNKNHLDSIFSDVDQHISADILWQDYQKYGLKLANEYGLLRGDDDAWNLKASNLFESNPLKAKALYAALAFTAQLEIHRKAALIQLVKLVEKQTDGLAVIHQLFLNSQQISNVENVPESVRYRLVDYALSNADIKSAAKLMENLQQPPEGEPIFDWNLRRARILILSNGYQEGTKILMDSINGIAELTDAEIDQYIQVVFDLQNVHQHDLALSTLNKLDMYTLSPKMMREIAYWKAESLQSKGEFDQAAYLFLKSAQPIDGTFDPWYHTASFKAAESLAKAMLFDDARHQYLRLLKITENSARKAVIRQRLQQLRLQQSKEHNTTVAK